MFRPPRIARLLSTTAWLALTAAAACGGEEEVPVVAGVIDRETFIDVYVDLRVETVQGSDLALPDEERDRILARHGVDTRSLVDFVDAYGRDLDYMNALWAEVERRLEARPPVSPPDASGI